MSSIGVLANAPYTYQTAAQGGISAATIWTITRSQSEINKIVGGLRIKKVTTNDGRTSNDIVKNYSYNTFSDPEKTSGVLLYMPKYVSNFSNWIYKLEANPGETCDVGIGNFDCYDIEYTVYSSIGNNSIYSGQGSHIGYTNISVKETNNGKVHYFYELGATSSFPLSSYPFIQPTYNNKFGQLLQEEHFLESGEKNYEIINTYVVGATTISNGHDIIKMVYVPINQDCWGSQFLIPYVIPFTDNSIVNGYSILTETTERLYNIGTGGNHEKKTILNYSLGCDSHLMYI